MQMRPQWQRNLTSPHTDRVRHNRSSLECIQESTRRAQNVATRACRVHHTRFLRAHTHTAHCVVPVFIVAAPFARFARRARAPAAKIQGTPPERRGDETSRLLALSHVFVIICLFFRAYYYHYCCLLYWFTRPDTFLLHCLARCGSLRLSIHEAQKCP